MGGTWRNGGLHEPRSGEVVSGLVISVSIGVVGDVVTIQVSGLEDIYMDFLKNLALDAWYMVLVAVGTVVLLMALAAPLQLPNTPVALFGLGALLIGLGEWKNHRKVQKPLRKGSVQIGFTIFRYRKFSALGVAFDLLGLAAIGFGGWLLWLIELGGCG